MLIVLVMAIILPTPLPFKLFLHSKMKLNQIEPILSQKIFVILPPTTIKNK